MKILTTLNYYHPHWTGLTMYAQRIAEGLVQRGHEVTVLTSQHDRSLPRDETLGGVRIVRLPVAFRLSRAMVMPSFAPAVARLIRAHDVLHIHSPSSDALLAAAVARVRRRPVVVTHQGDVVMPAGALNRAVQGMMTANLSGALRLAAAVTTHSADYADHSRFLAPFAGTVHAINPPTVIPAPDTAHADAWRREVAHRGGPVVGFAGRFVEEKGFDVLLRAAPTVLDAFPDATFVFAGETNVVYERFFEQCRPLLDRLADAVVPVGLLLDRQRLADFYAMCDLFVLPSRTDCFAAVQLEAMLCGTRVVASDIPGAREVVTVTGMGRLAAPNDPADLAAQIIAELREPTAAPERSKVAALFDPDDAIDRYEAVLADAVAGRAPAARRQPAHALPPLPEAQTTVVSAVMRNEADIAYRRRVPRLLEYLQLDDRDLVLDCGSGMGYLSLVLHEVSGATVVAADRDIARLQWAVREHVPAVPAAIDIASLPFADGSFDKILLSEVLEHLPDDVGALRELWRVLRPGGVLAVCVPHANYPFWWDPINASLELVGAPPMRGGPITGQWTGHERLYLPAELRQVAERAAFEVTNIDELTHHSAPFHHALVYSVGKPLIEKNLLPPSLRVAADRFRGRDNAAGRWNPVNLAVGVLHAIDRRNDRPRVGGERSYVSLLARLHKPDGDGR